MPFRLFRLSFALILALAALPICQGAWASPLMDKIGLRNAIRVGLTGDYAPFSTYDPASDTFEGLDVDLARSLAKKHGVHVIFVHTSWPTLSDDLKADKFDIAMGGISVTPTRQAIGFFSHPVMRDGKTPITLCKNVKRFQTLAQIDEPGVRLIVNPGGTNEKFARAHIHKAQIILHPDNKTIFDEIVAGHADLIITDAIETRLQAKRHPSLCAVHPDKPFDRSEKAFWMPKDWAWRQLVNKWLDGMKESGELQAKIDEWVN
jgi:cyclohexadienyl dehydratase